MEKKIKKKIIQMKKKLKQLIDDQVKLKKNPLKI